MATSPLRIEGDDDQPRMANALAELAAAGGRRYGRGPQPAVPGPVPVWQLLRQQFVPHLTDPATYQRLPPPDIAPNAAGKVPAVESDPRVQGASADLANLLANLVGPPGAKTVVAAAVPAIAKGARTLLKPAGEAAAGTGAGVAAPYVARSMPSTAEVAAAMLAERRPEVAYHYSGPMKALASAGVGNPPNPLVQTVRDPYRMMFPGIYRDPREIAQIAAGKLAPEDPMLKRLWGVNREDLYQMGLGRVGADTPPIVGLPANPRGSESARRIMTPRNEQRIIDTLVEGGKVPGLRQTDAWYVMDPMYHRMVQEFGPAEGLARYKYLNGMTSSASPGSDVLTEIQRGTGAHWLANQGRFEDFAKYGGVALEKRGADFPEDMRYILGHAYHNTSQLPNMRRVLGGTMESEGSEAVKVPTYMYASGIPGTGGFQTTHAVGDAHFSRGVGLSDTRKGPTDVQGSWSAPEYQTLVPWWRESIARPVGIEAVPGQARLWNILGPQTGVETDVGAGKLELLSQQIAKAATRLGVSPETARDLVLKGAAGAGVVVPGAVGLGSMMSDAVAPQQQYQ
jgi:hypothetical protein